MHQHLPERIIESQLLCLLEPTAFQPPFRARPDWASADATRTRPQTARRSGKRNIQSGSAAGRPSRTRPSASKSASSKSASS